MPDVYTSSYAKSLSSNLNLLKILKIYEIYKMVHQLNSVREGELEH